jgi:nucleoid-associated protein YgaU
VDIGFYFSGTQLPVNPAKLTVKRQGNNQRTEVVPLGEINILRTGKLAAVSFDFLLPGHSGYPFVTGPWREPESLRQYFDGHVADGQSIKFTVSGIGFSQRMSVEDFSAVRAAGDHESLECSISLLEYRNYGARVLRAPAASTGATMLSVAPARPSDKPQASTYTVKPGDSFWRIAQQQLGDGSRYNEVAQANGMTAASVIHPGNVLKLPAK